MLSAVFGRLIPIQSGPCRGLIAKVLRVPPLDGISFAAGRYIGFLSPRFTGDNQLFNGPLTPRIHSAALLGPSSVSACFYNLQFGIWMRRYRDLRLIVELLLRLFYYPSPRAWFPKYPSPLPASNYPQTAIRSYFLNRFSTRNAMSSPLIYERSG